MTKNCTKCKEIKELYQFGKNKRYNDGLQKKCSNCINMYNHTRYATIKVNDPEKHKARLHACTHNQTYKKTWLLRKYSLTIEQYNKMLQDQNNKCAICSIDFSTLKKAPCIDHDHYTNKIRELLCNPCNMALGLIKDNTGVASNMAMYLKRHKEEQN